MGCGWRVFVNVDVDDGEGFFLVDVGFVTLDGRVRVFVGGGLEGS